MSQTREAKIINGLLIICLVAGFACFALILLPDQLKRANYSMPGSSPGGPSNFSSIIKLKTNDSDDRPIVVTESIARFTPEPEVRMPGGASEDVEETEGMIPDVAGGPGAAIDDSSMEAREALEGTTLARGSDDEGNEEYVEIHEEVERLVSDLESRVVRHKPSRLAVGAPSLLGKNNSGKRWVDAPAELEIEVAFWRDIYSKYDTDQILLHHPKYLDIVYDIVDLSDITRNKRLTDREKEYMKEKRVQERRDDVNETLEKLSRKPSSTSLTENEWHIKQQFVSAKGSNPFKNALDVHPVRAQRGQKDKFIEGLKVSGKYLGEIEDIYEEYGMPVELTRLIFVESMFNTRARSSVGASGIWQFMKGTGDLYLRINDIVDERNDPLLATHASAKLLRHNHNELRTWPLAINAYNAGRGRMSQAVKQLGTRDISKIIKRFNHGSYRFASRNFFPEFLAALEVAEHYDKYFGPVDFDDPQRYEIVRSPYHISLPDVARIASIDMSEITELNPAFTSIVTSGKKLVPSSFAIRVPEGKGDLFLVAAARSPKSKQGPIKHVVERGESLSYIAKMYGVDTEELRSANRGIRRNPRRGQKIIVPFK